MLTYPVLNPGCPHALVREPKRDLPKRVAEPINPFQPGFLFIPEPMSAC